MKFNCIQDYTQLANFIAELNIQKHHQTTAARYLLQKTDPAIQCAMPDIPDLRILYLAETVSPFDCHPRQPVLHSLPKSVSGIFPLSSVTELPMFYQADAA